MSENIYDLANQLERGIRQLPEYQSVEEVRAAIEADAEAKAIFDDYLAFQQEVQALMQSGQLPDQAFQDKATSFNQKIQSNQLVASYFGLQQKLSVYIADIEKIVFGPLQDLL